MQNQQVIVTGGSGFIGQNLVRKFTAAGRSTTVFDLELFPGSKSEATFGVHSIVGDILDFEAIKTAMQGHDSVVHLAAQTEVPTSIENPEDDCRVNVLGTFNVLRAARETGISSVVFASSAATLGRQEPPVSESSVPLPLSPYGASKLAGEAYCSAFFGTWGLKTKVLRFSNVYGPFTGNKEGVVAKFMKNLLDDSVITIDGTGDQTRDFIYVEDLCDAIMMAVESEIGGETYQMGTGQETSISSLAETIVSASGVGANIQYRDARQGDVFRSYSDISKIKKDLGWSPITTLDEGIVLTWDWFKTIYDPPRQ
jgi:UDP-glucose 4-epimerase